jgi:predicted GTPase
MLAGRHYPRGIPIHHEKDLPRLIKKHRVDQVILAYSDLSNQEVMDKVSLITSCGADFRLMGPGNTMVKSRKPVISVCAVRTGAGKSPVTRRIAKLLVSRGIRFVIIRHPMSYGDLEKQACQRFASYEDLKKHKTTIEEKEEYEGHIKNGFVVYAGVDYEKIVREAEKEADVIIWDGGNNDMSFYKSDLYIVVADARRPGHEVSYYPGQTNLRMADVIIINKVESARPEDIKLVESNVKRLNKKARVMKTDMKITIGNPVMLKGKRVLAVDDGPTITHGGLPYGAAYMIARQCKAKSIVDPRPHAAGSIKEAFKKYPHITAVLPALGYGKKQIEDLEQTINKTPCDIVVVGTPTDISRYIKINKPVIRVSYELKEIGRPTLKDILNSFLLSQKIRP